jgi:acetyltransferase-like isoleucine patch superfamily enzyme
MLIKKSKIPVLQIVLIGFLPSFLKKIFYRLKGYKIGKNVSIGPGSVIIGKKVIIKDFTSIGFISVIRGKEITLGRHVKVGSLCMIDTEVIIVDEDARINENVIIAGIKTPESMIKIGKRAIIMEYSFINPTKPVIIGDDSGIGGHCLLFTHGSWLSQLDGFPVTFAPITLGKKVWLPWRVFIMPGVTIGDEVVIGANSLISRDLPSNVMAAGSPARIIKENYPPPISNEKRSSILQDIFKDFMDFLTYNEFRLEKKKFDGGFSLELNKKNKSHLLVYITNDQVAKANIERADLLVIDGDFISSLKADMVLNLTKKTRLGLSELGEEFTKYLSRHGVRFDRLD